MADDPIAQARAYGTPEYRSDTRALLRRLADDLEHLRDCVGGVPVFPQDPVQPDCSGRFDG